MPQKLTSQSHPIEVHFVPAGDLPLRGKIGFTLAPGRKGPGEAGMHDRDLATDMQRLRFLHKVTMLVSLVTEQEATERTKVSVEEERRAAESRGMMFHHLPVTAGSTPDDDAFVDLIQMLREQVEIGRTVVVHDRAGGGRAATVVSALLIAQGHDASAAIATVRNVRPKAVDPMQEKKLRAIAARLASRSTPMLEVVEKAFVDQGWNYDRKTGTTTIQAGFKKDGTAVPLTLVTAERAEILTVTSRLQMSVPAESRASVGELLHRINWTMPHAAFELDYDDGEVRLWTSIDVDGGSLAPGMVKTLVNAAVFMVGTFAPAVAAVAHGGVSPRDALGKQNPTAG